MAKTWVAGIKQGMEPSSLMATPETWNNVVAARISACSDIPCSARNVAASTVIFYACNGAMMEIDLCFKMIDRNVPGLRRWFMLRPGMHERKLRLNIWQSFVGE